MYRFLLSLASASIANNLCVITTESLMYATYDSDISISTFHDNNFIHIGQLFQPLYLIKTDVVSPNQTIHHKYLIQDASLHENLTSNDVSRLITEDISLSGCDIESVIIRNEDIDVNVNYIFTKNSLQTTFAFEAPQPVHID